MPVAVDSRLLDDWVHAPARAVADLVARSQRRVAALHELSAELAARLQDQSVRAGWIHGDFTLGNVLFDERGETVTGLIDWERTGAIDLPAIDRMMLRLAIELELTRRQLGDLVAAIALGQAPRALNDSLTRIASTDVCQPLDARALTLLCWLRHTAAHATYRERSARLRLWQHHNVDRVLDALALR